MGKAQLLPAELTALAERESWFSRANAGRVLDWLEQVDLPLYGFETARKLPNGDWMLLLNPMIDFDAGTAVEKSIKYGRVFLDEHAADGMMFEPRWPGY